MFKIIDFPCFIFSATGKFTFRRHDPFFCLISDGSGQKTKKKKKTRISANLKKMIWLLTQIIGHNFTTLWQIKRNYLFNIELKKSCAKIDVND